MSAKKILIVEDENSYYISITNVLSNILGEIEIFNSSTPSNIASLIDEHDFDLVTLDYNLIDPYTDNEWKGTDLIPLLEKKRLLEKTIIISNTYFIDNKEVKRVAAVISKNSFIYNTDAAKKVLEKTLVT
ncbi:MAG: hypothetical protein M1320_01560 [Patescibacteria group bacterium]|nr:hypothetical protein [Patescibacteria group bacterium]